MANDVKEGLVSADVANAIRRCIPPSRLASFPEPPGAAAAAVAEAVRRDPAVTAVVAVLPTPVALDMFAVDAVSLSGSPSLVREYPMLDLADDDPEAVAARLSVLGLLGGRKAPRTIVATCVQAMMQASPDPEGAERMARRLQTGAEHPLEDLVEWLAESGYRRDPEVYEPCSFAVKGGILDVWPVASRMPARIEFFGDTVESIRTFSHLDQRSVGPIVELRIHPAKMPRTAKAMLHAYIPDGAVVMWLGHEEIAMEGAAFAESASISEEFGLAAIQDALLRRESVRHLFSGDPPRDGTEPCVLPFGAVGGLSYADTHRHDPDFMASERHKFVAECTRIHRDDGAALHFCLDTPGTLGHLSTELDGLEADLRVAPLSGGFAVVDDVARASEIFVSQADLYGHSKRMRARAADPYAPGGGPDGIARSGAAELQEMAVQLPDDISPGNLVVHIEYGIGKYLGMRETKLGGQLTEAMCIEYANRTKVFVPVSQANLISRYKGAGDVPVKLHAIGGRRWAKEKDSAQNSVQLLAMRMLETQARRKQMHGHAFSPHTPYLQEFEAAFPFAETPGQAECIRQVKADMESPYPMDRIVCGDAGYGKTEVAIRAAFICAMQGRQVAVLVPTTVLAQQHYDTFVDRMAAYPLNIAMHSRFCTRAQRDAALEGAASGAVDILIGTHGIIQPGVRFKDLGLVIIDEEQRFGVGHKEALKALRLMVDVLTLSATPIPRTLYLGLTGARDMSLLQTPPRERVATETRIVHQADDIVKNAILAEVNRGGQVFYLHNRVLTIEFVYRKLKELLPHLRIAVGHGQMPSVRIEETMRDFAAGRYDVLLSTTIIESGIDIPRANTILVDRADRFGIADLYQLRGRVGRGGVKAYAYFLIPPDSYISPDSRQRLKALQQHSGLGTGVRLSMRDLSIRGAGNILGAEQSGHISAVGFNLYCQLLRRAVARLRGEKPPALVNVAITLPFLERNPSSTNDAAAAFLPYSYIEDDTQRIEFHRRLAECATQSDLDGLGREMSDRFGAMPEPLKRLLVLYGCRILAAERGITRIDMREGNLIMHRDGVQHRTRTGKLPRPAGNTPDEILESIRNLVLHA